MTALLLRGGRRTFLSLRKHRNYRLFFTGQVVSVSGTWMQNIAMYWYVLTLTHDPLSVGILSVCRFGPFTIFGLLSGVIADRFDNRRTVIVTQAVQMALSAVLAGLALTGHADEWQVYAIAAGIGTALVLDAPARQGLTFQMVGRDELPNAVALNSTLFNVARIAGPAIAGITIAAVGVSWCFVANTFSFLAVLASLVAMRERDLFQLARRGRPTLVRGTREGLAYVRRSRSMLVMIGMMVVFASICFNFNILLPILAKQTLDAGPGTFGVISAAFGAGALVGALATAAIAAASWRTMFFGATGFALTELALAPVQSVAAATVLLFVCGIFFTSYTSNSNARIQLEAPDHLRGRVLSLYYYAWNGLAPVGGVIVGWLCATGGTELAFVVAGCSGLMMAALGALALRAPQRVDPVEESEEPGEELAAA
ncbi:MAG: MFS transporter [Gaiellaceae bacterium]